MTTSPTAVKGPGIITGPADSSLCGRIKFSPNDDPVLTSPEKTNGPSRSSAGLDIEGVSVGCGMLSTVQWSDSLADVCTLVTLIGTQGGPAQEGMPKGQKVEGIQMGR
ncbi:hypothetical protein SRHO_G00080180 [Serrasalmus rhombeus]